TTSRGNGQRSAPVPNAFPRRRAEPRRGGSGQLERRTLSRRAEAPKQGPAIAGEPRASPRRAGALARARLPLWLSRPLAVTSEDIALCQIADRHFTGSGQDLPIRKSTRVKTKLSAVCSKTAVR